MGRRPLPLLLILVLLGTAAAGAAATRGRGSRCRCRRPHREAGCVGVHASVAGWHQQHLRTTVRVRLAAPRLWLSPKNIPIGRNSSAAQLSSAQFGTIVTACAAMAREREREARHKGRRNSTKPAELGPLVKISGSHSRLPASYDGHECCRVGYKGARRPPVGVQWTGVFCCPGHASGRARRIVRGNRSAAPEIRGSTAAVNKSNQSFAPATPGCQGLVRQRMVINKATLNAPSSPLPLKKPRAASLAQSTCNNSAMR